MTYNFDREINRRNTNCVKWDEMPEGDIIPMWVADMDFETAPCIMQALQQRMQHGCFGYTFVPESFYEATIQWFQRRHHWSIDRKSFIYTSGVVPAISAIIKGVTELGIRNDELGIDTLSSPKHSIPNSSFLIPNSPALRPNFSYIPQGNTLFSGTIRDNLLMGNPDATPDEMRHALQLAMADFVFNLPDGLDTKCAEQGGGLSEGQAQRIAIARAILHPCKVLLLDEATSALDVETEKKLLENLKQHFSHSTIIFVTHRLAVVDFTSDVLRMTRQ